MKPSKLTRFLASTVGALVAIAATLTSLVIQIARAIFGLPMVLIQNAALGAAFMRRRLEPRETNAQINARLLADPRMEGAEFIIVADSGKNGDEDRKIPFPKGFLAAVGLHHGQRVGQDRAVEVSKQFLASDSLRKVIEALLENAGQNPDLTKPSGHITSETGCP